MSVTTNEGTNVVKTQEQTIYLDLVPGGLPPIVHVSQNDTAARVLVFRILENGSLITTAGLTAMMRCLKPDGAYFSCSCTVREYLIACPCYAQMTACPGQVKCELQITTTAGQISTANFILDVEEDPTAQATSSITVVSDFQDWANQASASASAAAGSALAAATSEENVEEYVVGVESLRRTIVTTAGTNLNDYTTAGIFYFAGEYTPVNIPAGTNGTLIVIPNQGGVTNLSNIKQLWLRQGTPGVDSFNAWERSKTSSTDWSAWAKYLTDFDVTITGAATTILTSDLTANRALISNASGKVMVSSITRDELYQLTGLSTAQTLQTQLNTHTTNIATNATNINKVMPTMLTAQNNLGSDSVSVPTGTATNLGSITLSTGIWIVTFTCRWNNPGNNGSGYRQILVTSSSGSVTPVDFSKVSSIPGVVAATTTQQITAYFYITSSSATYYLTGYQTNGSSLTAEPRYAAVRLGAGSI